MADKTVVLLGAGASQEAGLPLTHELTKRVVDRIHSPGYASKVATALNFVVTTLTQYNAQRGAGAFDSVDIEHVFTAVDLLAKRDELEVSPFVSAWHPAVEAVERPAPHPFATSDLDRALRKLRTEDPTFGPERDVARVIADFVDRAIAARAGTGTGFTFQELEDRMVEALCEELVPTQPLDYLGPLAALVQEQGELTIATLNYDLTVEQFARGAGVPVHRGIESWSQSGALAFPAGGIHLLKLHGSVDWKSANAGAPTELQFPRKEIVIGLGARQPLIVFGRREKLRADGPFLDLLAEFRRALGDSQELVVVGYSFRDDHVNSAIKDWTLRCPEGQLTVIDPRFPERGAGNDRGFRADLLRYLRPLRRPDEPQDDGRLHAIRERAGRGLAEFLQARSTSRGEAGDR